VIDLDHLPYVIPKKNARFLLEKGVSEPTHSYHVIKEVTLLKCKTIDVYTIEIYKKKRNSTTWFAWFSYLTKQWNVKFFI
jgi:hypothetical protein